MCICTISSGEVSSLDHEVFDDPVELGSFVSLANILKKYEIMFSLSC